MEPSIFEAFDEICKREHTTRNKLATSLNITLNGKKRRHRADCSFTARIRIFVLEYFRTN